MYRFEGLRRVNAGASYRLPFDTDAFFDLVPVRRVTQLSEPDPARACRLGLRNPRDDHRNEDDVVDAKHDLERTQRQQRRPCLGTEEEFDHALKDLSRRIAPSLATT